MTRDLFGYDKPLPPRGEREVIDDLVFHGDSRSGDAALVSKDGDEAHAVWLPKSRITVIPIGSQVPGIKKDGQRTTLPVVTVTMPEWLAVREGFA